MKTSPSFSFYASDFIMGTMLMSAEEVGGYIRLLCWQWEQGELPSDVDQLARISGLQVKKLTPVLKKFEATERGGFLNKRLEEVRLQREHFIEVQRLNGSKGGRPKKPMENPSVSNGLTQTKPEKTLPSPSPSPSPITNPPLAPQGESAGASGAQKAKGTLAELRAFAQELGLPESDGEFMFNHWTANGWKNGNAPSKDWRAGMRKWKSAHWMPSQREQRSNQKPRNQAYDASTATEGLTGDQIGLFDPKQK